MILFFFLLTFSPCLSTNPQTSRSETGGLTHHDVLSTDPGSDVTTQRGVYLCVVNVLEFSFTLKKKTTSMFTKQRTHLERWLPDWSVHVHRSVIFRCVLDEWKRCFAVFIGRKKIAICKNIPNNVRRRINFSFVTDTILNTESIQQLKWYGAPCNIYNAEPNQNQKLIRNTVSKSLKSVIIATKMHL